VRDVSRRGIFFHLILIVRCDVRVAFRPNCWKIRMNETANRERCCDYPAHILFGWLLRNEYFASRSRSALTAFATAASYSTRGTRSEESRIAGSRLRERARLKIQGKSSKPCDFTESWIYSEVNKLREQVRLIRLLNLDLGITQSFLNRPIVPFESFRFIGSRKVCKLFCNKYPSLFIAEIS